MRNSDSQVVYDPVLDSFVDDCGHKYTEMNYSEMTEAILRCADHWLALSDSEIIVDYRDEDAKFGGIPKVYFRINKRD